MSSEKEIKDYIEKLFEAINKAGTDKFDAELIDKGWAKGYGFRTLAARDVYTEEEYRELMQRFNDSMERFKWWIEELNVRIDGDIGLVWGFHIEDFKVKGREPERVKVRFFMTLHYNEDMGWQILMGHRDIQKFDEQGIYIRDHEGA